MGRNIEKEIGVDVQKLLAIKNKQVQESSGVFPLLTELRDFVSNSDINEENPVISILKNNEDWESLILTYMWGDLTYDNNQEKRKSLTLVTSVADKNKIHLMFREVEQNGEIKKESSVFDVSNQDIKKEMLEKISARFYTSLIPCNKS